MHKVQREGKLADYKVACLKLKEKKGNYIGRKERVLFIHKKEQPRAWQEQLRAELAISYFLPGLTGSTKCSVIPKIPHCNVKLQWI